MTLPTPSNIFIGMSLVRLTGIRQIVEDALYAFPCPTGWEAKALTQKLDMIEVAERVAAKAGNIHPLS